MKKIIVILILLTAVITLSAETNTRQTEIINFDVTLKTLSALISEGKADTIDPQQLLILEGTVSAREVLNPDKENFSGILELSTGEWEGVENVAIYRCYVQLDGSEFAAMIPVRRSRKPNPLEISLNSRVLILGKYIGYSQDENGNKYPVIQGIKVRKE